METYLEPRSEYAPMAELWKDEKERAMVDAAVEFFLANPGWGARDRASLRAQFERLGYNMFIWKFYAAARCYIGGVAALSAHLKLRRSP